MMEGDISHQERGELVGEQLQRSPGGKNLYREDVKWLLLLCNELFSQHTPKLSSFPRLCPISQPGMELGLGMGTLRGQPSQGEQEEHITSTPRISSCFFTWHQLTPIPGGAKSQGQPPLASGSSSHPPSHPGIRDAVTASRPRCPSQDQDGFGFPRLTFKTGIR